VIFWLILAHIKFKKQKNHLFKKKTMKKLFVFTLTLPLLINCGGGEEIKNEEATIAVEQETPETPAEPEKPLVQTEFKIDEPILTEDGYTITFLSTATDYEFTMFNKAEEGEKFLSIEALVENTTDEVLSLLPYDFDLIDDDGERYGHDFTQSKEPSLTLDDIRPGKKRKGWVQFVVPEEKKTIYCAVRSR
jgi:hypothetical protein